MREAPVRHPVALQDVPETMLWTLHNRAAEAARADGYLRDPLALAMRGSIDYDFDARFGPPDGSHGMRSRVFDDVVRPWLALHPGGTVVELGCGLETQFHRLDDGHVRWWCVDVPEALAVRERFLAPTDRCRHLACSALDDAWLDAVDPRGPVFVTAQGLLMYFEPDAVRDLLATIARRLSQVDLLFDAIPRWFSRRTQKGFWKTPRYRAPPMPWGVDGDELDPLLRDWLARPFALQRVSYGPLRGVAGRVQWLLARTPVLRDRLPMIVHLRVGAIDGG
mgnify:CR=1 FL=1